MTDLVSPLTGAVLAMSEVPDPVFAQGIVGPGLAVEPSGDGEVTVVAPVSGRVVKMHPHAFVIQADGFGVLVHLGIDTVQLEGRGFTLHASEGDEVRAGDEIVTWNPSQVVAGGRSAVCPIVLLDATPERIVDPLGSGTAVSTGDVLLGVN